MKKLVVIAAIFLTVSIFTLSAYAMGGGMRGGMSGGMGGGHMKDNSGSGLLEWFQNWRDGSAYTNPPVQERKRMEELDRQHNEDSAYLEYQIQMKEKELDALLKSIDPDIEKVRAIRRDIRELRSMADQERRNYELEAGKINPGYRSGSSDGRSSYGSPGRRGRGDMGYDTGMGSGMMGGMRGPQYGPQYGPGYQDPRYQQPQKPMDETDAKELLENYLQSTRNPNLKVGKIDDKGNVFEAEIQTKEGSLVDKILVDKRTGWMRSIY